MTFSLRNLAKRSIEIGFSQEQKNRLLRVLAPLARDQLDALAHQYSKSPHMKLGLEKLAARGLQPDCIVDIGAFEGGWSRITHEIWPGATQILIEGNAGKAATLEAVARDLGASLEIALMGPEDDVQTEFHVMESGSSVLSENSPLDRVTETIPTRRLDTLLKGQSVDFLKLDVQGFELQVLNGGQAALHGAQAVLLEVSLLRINEGAPLMAEVVSYMSERGFDVLDVLEVHHRPLDGATNQIDLLFAPKDSMLFSDTRHFA